MIRKVFAFVASAGFVIASCFGALGAQGAAKGLPTAVCTSHDLESVVAVYNFGSPDYQRAAQTVPAGVRSYLGSVIASRLKACTAIGGAQIGTACVPPKGETDAQALWRQLKFCEGALGLDDPPAATPLVTAQEPTLYVILGVGAGPGGASAGGGKVGGGGGAATGSTSTGSSVDSSSSFLMFIVAQRLQHDLCQRASTQNCDVQHPVAVVPESGWNVEDLRTQCAADPYVPTDPANPYGPRGGHGTLGAIVLNGSILTVDGTFAILTVYGSSEANYTTEAVQCKTAGADPSLTSIWSANISGSNKTTALSFFPLALAGTLIEARAAARTSTLPQPNASASPNVLNSYYAYQTDVALGTFASNTSGLTLGNPSSAQTLRHSFEAFAGFLEKDLEAYCAAQSDEDLCKALKLSPST
jgi:hypothetical protein